MSVTRHVMKLRQPLSHNSLSFQRSLTRSKSTSISSTFRNGGTEKSDTTPAASTDSSIKNSLSTESEIDPTINYLKNVTSESRIFREKTSSELIMAWLVFKLCKVNFLVTNNEYLMKLGYSVLGKTIFEKLMKMTFYGQFVGGENEEALKPLISKLQTNGIGAILDYAVEKDISKDEAVKAEMEASLSEQEKAKVSEGIESSPEEPLTRESKFLAHEEFGDRREDVVSARTYFYEDEKSCDENVEIFMKCIEMAAKCSNSDGFAAIKLTSLGRPQFLMQLSEVLTRTRLFFDQITDSYPGDVLRRNVGADQFSTGLNKLGVNVSLDEVNEWFTILDTNKDGTFNLLDWNELISNDRLFSELMVAPDPQSGQIKRLIEPLSDEEEDQMKNMLRRLDTLARAAKEHNVKLMIDAEQTYFQPAISRLAMELMKVYNKEKAVIFNTYQCYLKEAFNNLTIDMSFAEREGFYFGAKIVRGAYMDFERKRAEEIGYPDPINASYGATTRMYDRVVGECLNAISSDQKVVIMVASHNEESVNFTTERMSQLGIYPDKRQVYFGQLLGMCDRLSFRLGLGGYAVYKYVPFGPVKEVLPYLSRRAYENSSLLANTNAEVALMKKELKTRLFRL